MKAEGVPTRDVVPAAMAEAERWVLWKAESRGGRATKVPRRVDNPELRASSTNPATWATFDRACEALPYSGCDGLGFVLGDGFAGVDVDAVIDPETGEYPDWVDRTVELFDSYAEVSPSGTGLKIFTFGDAHPPSLPRHTLPVDDAPPINGKRPAVELYITARYFAVTGSPFGSRRDLSDGSAGWAKTLELLRSRAPKSSSDGEGSTAATGVDPAQVSRIRSALRAIGDPDDREQWLRMGMALHSTNAGEVAYGLWADWSAKSSKFDAEDQRRVWASFSEKAGAIRLGTLFHEAKQEGWQEPEESGVGGWAKEDFYAYMPMGNKFIFVKDKILWPGSNVDRRVPAVPQFDPNGTPQVDNRGRPVTVKASVWIGENRPVEQMTWAPGEPELVQDRMLVEGGWIEVSGARVFNQYQAPRLGSGDPKKAERWVELLRTVYPDDAEHVTAWLAHRVQRPQEKVNHALVLGGSPGVGKDTILYPARHAVGRWNCSDVSPAVMMGRFNGFVKAVIMRVSEARDLGETTRYQFYEHMKVYTASPPETLRVDEKHVSEYCVPNLCGVVMTTNHRTTGIYLPADDRRHYVAWSPLENGYFDPEFFTDLYAWFDRDGGCDHVAAYLMEYDLAEFDPKAPPPKTQAFDDIVAANTAPEDLEFADLLETMENPDAVAISELKERSRGELAVWLSNMKNARLIPHRMAAVGYVQVRNPYSKDGVWKVMGKRTTIYALKTLSLRDQVEAARVASGS